MENTSKTKETAKDTFLHLLSAAMIYLSVIGFIMLWWQIINFLFPDKLNVLGGGSGIYMTLIWATSALLVAFPVHILVSWIIGLDLRKSPDKRESQVRKWLWYITLFVSAITMIIDSVTLIFNFLRGDLTIQFFLKLIVILVAAGAVFGYYLWDLRKKETSNKPKRIALGIGILILASIIYGFSLVGSPALQRQIRFDEQRAMNLQEIQSAAINYWAQKDQLAADINALGVLGYGTPNDPETGKPYQYSVTGGLSFKLCADFKTKFESQNGGENYPYYSKQVGAATVPQNWNHGIGNACFETTIDPDFYKKQNSPDAILNPIPVK